MVPAKACRCGLHYPGTEVIFFFIPCLDREAFTSFHVGLEFLCSGLPFAVMAYVHVVFGAEAADLLVVSMGVSSQ